MDWGKIKQAARDVMTAFDVRPAEPDVKVRTLSGGNQQKLMVGRELSRKPTFIVASHPTRGLDIQAVDYLHRQLILARDGGAGILLISQDLKELLELSDHVVVMYRGAVAGEFPAAAVDLDVLGQLMLTGRASTPKVAAAG
jgi:general nucleoside transport system ATP-binding protein